MPRNIVPENEKISIYYSTFAGGDFEIKPPPKITLSLEHACRLLPAQQALRACLAKSFDLLRQPATFVEMVN